MDLIAVGVVRTSHGVRGHLKVKSLSGETDHLLGLERVTLAKGEIERQFRVEDVTVSGPDVLMKLGGVDSPEEARKFSSWEVRVPREFAARIEEGDYYIADLVRCRIVKDGRTLGSVRSVCEGAQADLLEIEGEDGKLHLVPFMDRFVGTVDLERQEIELKAEWLLE
jgi:16S rRNA processing protein RimM